MSTGLQSEGRGRAAPAREREKAVAKRDAVPPAKLQESKARFSLCFLSKG